MRAGIVLAGGRSSRMGRPKAWLPVAGTTMLDVVLSAITAGLTAGPDAPLLVVVGAPGQELPPLPRGVQVVLDEVEGEGPLRGLAAGLSMLPEGAAAYVSSCDVPLLRPAFVVRMFGLLGDADIAVPVAEGRHHPLAAVYRASVLPEVRSLLTAGQRRPFLLFERVQTREVPAEELRDVDPDLDSLRNVNTPEEYESLVEEGARAGVVFELYGTVRTRAGRNEIEVQGSTLGEALAALESACPTLAGRLIDSGRLAPHYRLSVNGRDFISDPSRPLAAGDRLILLSAAVGG